MTVSKIPPFPGFSYLWEQLRYQQHQEGIELRVQRRRIMETLRKSNRLLREAGKCVMGRVSAK